MKKRIPFLFNFFSSFEGFTEEAIEHILSQFEPISYHKGAIILDIGQTNDKVIFVLEGILREYSYKDQDQTTTHWLIAENEFQYVVDSFLEQKPSTVAIQVVEKAKLWVISKQKLDKLYEEFPQLNFVGRVLVEQNLKKHETFMKVLRKKNNERLDWYYTYHSNLNNRVPQKHIATYLNMSESELSRARNKK